MSVLSLEYINNSHVISVNCITQEFTWFTICILWCVFLQKIWTFWHILYWFRTRVQYAYHIHIIKQLFYIKPSFTFNPIFMFILGLWDIIYFHFCFVTFCGLNLLETVDEMLFRKLSSTPKSTSEEMLYLQLECLPHRNLIKKGRLMFLF